MSDPSLTLDLRQSLTSELWGEKGTCRRGQGFADQLDVDPEGSIRGRAVPIGKWVQLTGGLMERYEPGVFSRQTKDPARVKVCLEHGQVIGRVTALEERDDGLHFTGRISASDDIPEARKARAMLADGLMDELSIGFRVLKGGTEESHQADGTTLWRHRRAHLLEISLVSWGAMGSEARLTRALLVDDFDEHADERLVELRGRQDAAREWLRRFQAKMGD